MVKCKPFDKRDANQLRARGFEIAADGETATRSGAMTIEIIQPAHWPGAFDIRITLPDGTTLDATAYRLSDDEPEEDDAA